MMRGVSREFYMAVKRIILVVCWFSLGVLLLGVGWLFWQHQVWNNPYPAIQYGGKVFYTSFQEPPKTLDVARSYSVDSSIFVNQIVEPLFEYDYLKRPYQLNPLLAASPLRMTYLDQHHKVIERRSGHQQSIHYTQFDIKIKPGIVYQRHLAFARGLTAATLTQVLARADTPYAAAHVPQSKRFVHAQDFVYEIKRLADPTVQSPIFPLMAHFIVGLSELRQRLLKEHALHPKQWVDLRSFPLEGAKAVGPYHLRVTIKGRYASFKFWLAMAFFAPVPWEVDQFYAQPEVHAKQWDWNHWPIGTGPYYLHHYEPNRLLVLSRNPRYRPVFFPDVQTMNEKWAHYRGKRLPMIDHFVFSLEKEMIPAWHKFLQGYYDLSGVGNNQFDHAITVTANGFHLTKQMRARAIRLRTSVGADVFYLGMNMHDPILGGYSQKAKWLRQAIALTINYHEYIALFANGRGLVAQGPIPPSVYQASKNPVLFVHDGGLMRRKSNADARNLLAKAGYPHGIDPKTGKPLVLYFDTVIGNGPDSKARLDWYRKQFLHLGVSLHVRATQYNRFQDKVRHGQVQLFQYGWVADYPDAENFLFLFYGPNDAIQHHGVNYSNYHNKAFDHMFAQYQHVMDPGKRHHLVQKMLAILYQDTPWVWGFHSKSMTLYHHWMYPIYPSTVIYNRFKYYDLNTKERAVYQSRWNQPDKGPLFYFLLCVIGGFVFACWRYRQSQQMTYAQKRASR
jgi:oligopeptide transport system substrate-binding protein